MFFIGAVIGLLTTQSCLASTQGDAGKLDHGIFEWIHSSEGGYYNPKQEFRHGNPDDLSSLVGVFANERIEKGDLLCKVPWDRILFDEDECGTATMLAQAMRDGEKSDFAPYALYLGAQRRGQLPTAWSDAGQDLLDVVQGIDSNDIPRIPPSNTFGIADEWLEDCAGWGSYIYDELWLHAALLCHQRADDYIMIPAYDMYNHRNGNWTNAATYWKHGEPHVTRASRTIEAGEQIYISYDKCPECGGRAKPGSYGTAQFIRDYGFVEVMPQRWVFLNGRIVFDMYEKDPGMYKLEWHFAPEENKMESAKKWLQKEVIRLTRWKESMNENEEIKKEVNNLVPPQELYVIFAFCDANILAMKTALQSLEEGVYADEEEDDEEEDDDDEYDEGDEL